MNMNLFYTRTAEGPVLNLYSSHIAIIGALVLIVAFAISCHRAAVKAGLSELPGPRFARYSNLWRLWNAQSGKAPLNFQKLHHTYGKVVRIGPNHVSISDPALIPVIYGVSSRFTKSTFYNTLTPLLDGKPLYSIFSTQSQEHHRALKSGIAQKYSLTSLLRLEPLVDEVTELFVQKMRAFAAQSATMNFGEWLQYYAFDVIGAITFTQTFGFLDSGSDYNGVIEGLDAGLKYGAVVGQVPLFHPWLFGSARLEKLIGRIPALDKKNPVPIVFRMVQDALRTVDSTSKENKQEDFLSFLRKQVDKGAKKMSDRDMTNHMFVNLLAGSDTTAISLRSIFYFLMKNPQAMAKLLDQIYTADREGLLSPIITYTESQKHIPYLALIIKEALRLHPAVALPLERKVPEGGLALHGHHLPAGTIVGMNAWVLHYDEEVFGHDMNKFRPERWEVNDSPAEIEQQKAMERSFFAFGHGSRTCIGKNISLLEMSKFVPQILREFKMDWAGNKEWTVESSWFAKQSGVQIKLQNNHVYRGRDIEK